MQPVLDEAQAEKQLFEPIPAKLIFNPASGRPGESPAQLVEILTYLQDMNILPEVYLVHTDSNLQAVALNAIERGIKLIIVSGGDGTIDSVTGALVGTDATLGILPTGTQNNVALSLGIPADNLEAAVQLLRQGHRLAIDVGYAQCCGESRWFLEACSVGLLSAIFPAADDIQRGNFTRIGDFLATLISSPIAEMKLRLDGGRDQIVTKAHVVLISNMPYIGAHFQASSEIAFDDSRLDVFIYANLNKLDLIGYAVQAVGGIPDDPRIHHYRVSNLTIETDPPLTVMADGFLMGDGPLQVRLERGGLAVMAGLQANQSLVAEAPSRQEGDPGG